MINKQDEVALFIDFDNIRLGYSNIYGLEPEPRDLMQRAREFGRVIVAVAYADFSECPASQRRELEVAGIIPHDTPPRNGHRRTSSAAMAMLMDIVDCLLDRPAIGTYILMTGDSDFVRVVARARHRFGKRVIVAGVSGTISQDLIASADDALLLAPEGVDPLEPTRGQPAEQPMSRAEVGLLHLIDYLQKNRPYLTLNFIHSYAVSPTGRLRLSDMAASRLIDKFLEAEILIPFERQLEDGRVVVNVYLNEEHPWVRQILQGPGQPANVAPGE